MAFFFQFSAPIFLGNLIYTTLLRIDPPSTKLIKMVTRKRKQEAVEEEELQALPSDESEEEEE